MAKAKGLGLVDDVIAAMPQQTRGIAPWYERLAPEHRAEVEAVKAAWRAGTIGTAKQTAARIISEKLNERGISTIGTQGVLAWLEKD